MKRTLVRVLGFVVALGVLGGCVAVVDPYPARVYVPGPRLVVAPPPVVVAPRPWGWGHHRSWHHRGHRW
jgi:hypothetical protein